VQHVPHHRTQDQERLSRGDLDRLVRSLGAGRQPFHWILGYLLVDDPDFKDSVHDAPNLGHRSPRVLILVVQPVEPLLDFKRFDVLGNLIAPFRDKDVANIVLKDGLGVLRLRTRCDLGIKLDLEVVLGKLIELDPTCARIGAVDPDTESKAIQSLVVGAYAHGNALAHSRRDGGVPPRFDAIPPVSSSGCLRG
jgi:hypothetical protein